MRACSWSDNSVLPRHELSRREFMARAGRVRPGGAVNQRDTGWPNGAFCNPPTNQLAQRLGKLRAIRRHRAFFFRRHFDRAEQSALRRLSRNHSRSGLAALERLLLRIQTQIPSHLRGAMAGNATLFKNRPNLLLEIDRAARGAGGGGSQRSAHQRPAETLQHSIGLHTNFVTPGIGRGATASAPFQSTLAGKILSCEFSA